MFKICHITSVHPWNDIRIFSKECRSLAQSGFDVNIIAFGAPDDRIHGVRIINAGEKPAGRLKRIFSAGNRIGRLAMNQNADVFHIHDPELVPLGKKLARNGKKVIYDIHEDVPRQLLDKPYLSPFFARLISAVFEIYENRSVRKFAALCCATPFIRDRFEKLHNLVVDINNYPLLSEIPDHNEDFTAEKQKKVCYIGAISEIRGLLPLVDAMSLCGGIRLDLAGEFQDKDLKQKAMKSEGWKFVNELGLIDRNVAQKIKSESMAGIVTFLPAANHVNAQPNKIFEYMAAELPVIGSDFPMWKEIILSNQCGFCVNPSSPREIADAIIEIVADRDKVVKMGNNGRKAVEEKYNWASEEAKLIHTYRRILIAQNITNHE